MGYIEVICGCMFAGKTETLIARVQHYQQEHKKVKIFKPIIDDRYSQNEVVSHSQQRLSCIAVNSVVEMERQVSADDEVIVIDEAQFFDERLIGFCEDLANDETIVLLTGLDLDFRGEPFGIMPELLARAEYVTKLTATCAVCGAPATRTQRLINGKPASYDDPIVFVDGKDSYEPRCRKCHEVKKCP